MGIIERIRCALGFWLLDQTPSTPREDPVVLGSGREAEVVNTDGAVRANTPLQTSDGTVHLIHTPFKHGQATIHKVQGEWVSSIVGQTDTVITPDDVYLALKGDGTDDD